MDTNNKKSLVRIPKGMCNNHEDVYLSRGHAIFDINKYQFIRPIDYSNINDYVVKDYDKDFINYYHIKLENERLDTLIVEGLIIEGYYRNNESLQIDRRNIDIEFLKQFC
jgi:hypothetical protein